MAHGKVCAAALGFSFNPRTCVRERLSGSASPATRVNALHQRETFFRGAARCSAGESCALYRCRASHQGGDRAAHRARLCSEKKGRLISLSARSGQIRAPAAIFYAARRPPPCGFPSSCSLDADFSYMPRAVGSARARFYAVAGIHFFSVVFSCTSAYALRYTEGSVR